METVTDKYNAGSLYTDHQRIIFVKAGKHAIVITCVQPMVSLDAVFPYAYVVAEKIAQTFDDRPVSPILSDFGKVLVKKPTRSKKGPKGFFLFSRRPTKGKLKSFTFKMVIGGDFAVGKTSLVHTFVTRKFEEDYKATIGTAILKKDCELRNLEVTVKLVIWDLGGQEQFTQVRTKYMKDAKAGFLVYNVTRPETFEKIPKWFEDFKSSADSSLELILVGNKIDLESERKVTTEQGEVMAKKLGIRIWKPQH